MAFTYIGTDRPWGSGPQTISIATFQQSSNKRPHLIHSGGPLLRPGLSHRKSPDGNVRAIRASQERLPPKRGHAATGRRLNAKYAQVVAMGSSVPSGEGNEGKALKCLSIRVALPPPAPATLLVPPVRSRLTDGGACSAEATPTLQQLHITRAHRTAGARVGSSIHKLRRLPSQPSGRTRSYQTEPLPSLHQG